jgi:hypothetical protein
MVTTTWVKFYIYIFLIIQARPLFKDRKKFHQMADPLLQGCYPLRGLYQSIAVAAMCLQEDAMTRPVIADVVTALNYLASQNYDPKVHPVSRFSLSPSRDKKSTSPSRDGNTTTNNHDKRENEKEKEMKMSHGEDRGFVGRMFGSRSPVSLSPDNRDVRVAHYSRMTPRQALGIRSSASNSPGHFNPTRDSIHPVRDTLMRESGASQIPSRMGVGAHYGAADEEGFSNQKYDVEEWLVRANGQLKCPSDREKAVAEARTWGENWRDKRRQL